MNLKLLFGIFIVGLLAGLLPFGLIALARSQPSPLPPVHPDQDMFRQQKFRSQRPNPMFADGRAMRPRLPGVVATSDLTVNNEIVNDPMNPHMIGNSSTPISLDDELTYQRVMEGTEPGKDGKPVYVKQFPVPVTPDLLERGRERYTINCSVCHGQSGYGDGTVALHAAVLKEAGNANAWVAPKNYHTDDMRKQPVGQLFNTITNGARTMPAYAKQVSVLDRWAIVAYVKALQRSQHAEAKDIPEAEQDKYK
jgi:mono/diheme cytochrome c family protein